MTHEDFAPDMKRRGRAGRLANVVFLACTIFAVLSLYTLIMGIIDRSFGFVAVTYEARFQDIEANGKLLPDATDAEIISVLRENIRPRILSTIELEKPLETLKRKDLLEILDREVLVPTVEKTWTVSESLFARASVIAFVEDNFPDAELTFRAWVNPDFIGNAQSSDALYAGIRGAILGSVFTILITILIAFPIGTAAAVWLEEYAADNWVNRFISTNIYNLSGVPSIIYGMLGLAVFVRGMATVTAGRTVLSASLTLALLILPVIIINAQEAIRAVPKSLRYSSLAVGGTKWQTIWHHVLPSSMDRILTGTVLGISRAIGETAPLVVVGASAFLTQDPTSPFSKFTTLPIQIYQWTSYPEEQFRNLAAGAILVLLVLLISLNTAAIIMRNKYRKERRV